MYLKSSFIASSLAIVSLPAAVLGFSEKAGQCSDNPASMSDGMGGENQDLGWTIESSADNYNPGDQITVTVNGPGEAEGMLLFARATNNAHLGTWDTPDKFQTLDEDCAEWGLEGSTLSHQGEIGQEGPLEFTWTAPSQGLGNIEFRGLIVSGGKESWQQFEPVSVSGPGSIDDGTGSGGNGTDAGRSQGSGSSANTPSKMVLTGLLGAATYYLLN